MIITVVGTNPSLSAPTAGTVHDAPTPRLEAGVKPSGTERGREPRVRVSQRWPSMPKRACPTRGAPRSPRGQSERRPCFREINLAAEGGGQSSSVQRITKGKWPGSRLPGCSGFPAGEGRPLKRHQGGQQRALLVGDSGPSKGARASGQRTGSKPWVLGRKGGPSALQHLSFGELSRTVGSALSARSFREGGTTHSTGASPHRRPAQGPSLAPRAAWAKSGRSRCVYVSSFYLKLSRQTGRAEAIRLLSSSEETGHCRQPAAPGPSRQRVENLHLLAVQLVELPGQTLEGGFVVLHLLLWGQDGGRSRCVTRAGTPLPSRPHLLHTTRGLPASCPPSRRRLTGTVSNLPEATHSVAGLGLNLHLLLQSLSFQPLAETGCSRETSSWLGFD